MTNPYDLPDTCRCHAWDESECACGGFVNPALARAWAEGFRAAKDPTTAPPTVDPRTTARDETRTP